jgi:hypothetical protein
MIHGARAVLGTAGGKQDPRSQWIGQMRERRHPNVVAVALANKNARIVWSILARGEDYRPGKIAVGTWRNKTKHLNHGSALPETLQQLAGDGERVTLIASRTWCVDRQGKRLCLGAIEEEARGNPSGLAATKHRAAQKSRI